MSITSQSPELRAKLKVEKAAGSERFLNVSAVELKTFARLTGNTEVHDLSLGDLCATNSEISDHTAIAHV